MAFVRTRPIVLVSDAIRDLYGDQLLPLLEPPGGGLVAPSDAVVADVAVDIAAAFFSVDASRTGELAVMGRLLEGSPGLDWIHVGWSGVEDPYFSAAAQRGVRLTSSSGAAASAVAHHALGGLLSLMRGLHRAGHAQRRHRWEPFSSRDVDGATVVVVGLGPIGQEVMRLCDTLGAKVIGLRRSAPASPGQPPVWPLTRLDEALTEADAVVLALPLAPSTRHLMDARRLALLKPGAVLVNVGRGGLVDEPALVVALQHGRLAGAALDVTEVEPLPDESPLWDLPSVLLTPHTSGLTQGTEDNAAELFVANVTRWLTGAQLHNLVEPDRLIS